ncbi:GIY-YIG nuclease family protein [[Eubacterium] cellulosolvens]
MKGIYVLIIKLPKSIRVKIGKMGSFPFKEGTYLYIGSAMGQDSSSLEGRIRRHIENKKKVFWHIDYFLQSKIGRITHIISAASTTDMECKIAKRIEKILHTSIPVKKFGSSDCNCNAHFFKVNNGNLNMLDKLENIFSEFNLSPMLIKSISTKKS